MSIYLLLLCLIAVLLVFVRSANSDPKVWHVAPNVTADETLKGGAKRLVQGDLAQLDQIVRNEPRTVVLEGDVDGGMITYVTRSKLIGFPDYTTVQATDAGLKIFGRLRFGRSDFGVNAARVDRWINALGQL